MTAIDIERQECTNHRLVRIIKRLYSLVLFVTWMIGGATSTALAQETPAHCGTRGVLLQILLDGYAEAPIASGVTRDGKLIELLSNQTGWSWSIIVTDPNGQSCLVADGEGWDNLPASLPGFSS